MSVHKPVLLSEVRLLPCTVLLAAAMACLFPSFALAQGTPNILWFKNPIANIYSIAYSPDGKTLADAGGGGWGVVELRDASTGQVLQSFKTAESNEVKSVAFSPNGKTLADGVSNRNGGVLELWNVSTGKLVQALNTAARDVNAVAFSPDGKTLAEGGYYEDSSGTSYGGVVALWNVSTGKLVQSFKTAASYGVSSVAFSPDGKTLADAGYYRDNTGNYHGVLELWNLVTGKLVQSFNTAANYSGSNDRSSVAFSPDGKTLVEGGAGTNGGVLELWNVATGKRIQSLNTAGSNSVSSVAFSPDGKTLADGGDYQDSSFHYHGVLDLWNASTGKLIQSLKTAINQVNSVAFSPDGKTLTDGGYHYSDSTLNKSFELWNISTGKLNQSLNTANQVNSIAFSPDGKILADGEFNSSGSSLELWNVSTGKLVQSLNTAASSVNSVAFSPDGKTLAVGGDYHDNSSNTGSGVLELWNVATGKRIQSLNTAARNRVSSVAFSPDSKTLAVGGSYWDNSGNYQGVLEVWNVSTQKLVQSLNTAASSVNSVAFSPDGKTLAVGGDYHDNSSNTDSGVLEVWNVATGKLVQTPNTTASQVNSVAFSPDGKTLADGGYYEYVDPNGGAPQYQDVVELWSVATGNLIQSLNSAALAPPGVASLTFSPDGKTLTDGGYNILELWNVATGNETLYYDQFISTLNVLTFSPTREYIAYGSAGGLLAMALNPQYVAPTLQSLTLAASSLTGGKPTTGTLVLSGLAPTQGATVSLTSSNAAVTVPASVMVPSATTSITFPVTTKKVTAKTTVTLTAKWGNVSKTVTLTLTP